MIDQAGMHDWSIDLDRALATGDPGRMKAALSHVPTEVLEKAAPYLEAMAKNNLAQGMIEEAVSCFDQLLEIAPDRIDWLEARALSYFKLDQLDAAMLDANRVVELRPGAAIGYRLQARAHDELRERSRALDAYRRVLRLEPSDEAARRRIEHLEGELRKEASVEQATQLDLNGNALRMELPPQPETTFDPALFADPAVPDSIEEVMLVGLRQHLSRYSGPQSCRNVLARLEDPEWTSLWDAALTAVRGASVVFDGSELGVFALRARAHGAVRVTALEQSAMNERIAAGIVQKYLLVAWHALHGAEVAGWAEEERRDSFKAFMSDIHVATNHERAGEGGSADVFIFPNLDHSLLGTGIVKAIRKFQSNGTGKRVLPARARVFAMPIQWNYDASSFDLSAINDFRWALFPQALELTGDHWIALSQPTPLGVIDFEDFHEAQWNVPVQVTTRGVVDAILYWFELDLGLVMISSAPDLGVRAIRPAVQYVDATAVEPGQTLSLRINVLETRIHIDLATGRSKLRSQQLPSWYIPMLLDRPRNDAFRAAIASALKSEPPTVVLDIGAGCGLLSMMAAQAGAAHVFGCEVSPPLCKVAGSIIDTNELAHKITLINKDIRKVSVPNDLPERADLAIFELFDCSLIGEGVLHFIAHAREHLLKEGARFLPMTGRIRAAIVEYRLDTVLGVDVNLLNPFLYSPTFINVDATKLDYRELTEPFDVFEFDFASATPSTQESELSVPALSEGWAGAVLFWFDLQLNDSTWLSNAPRSEQLHWKQGLQFLPEVLVKSGFSLPLIVKHDGSSLSFGWKHEAIAKEQFSTLPRFDVRTWQHAKELENRTRGLLQHCAQNPGEYTKVAELAKRFAVDPARHDLDPTIAQRFVSTFFGT